MGEALLEARALCLDYRAQGRPVRALDRVFFRVARGERFVLLGPSGCGKSSLLKAIGGFLPISAGELLLKGRPISKPGPDRMVVFQEFDQLLPWKSVRENVLFTLRSAGALDAATAGERSDHYLARVGLAAFSDAYPHTLSGGMKQRVAIARAMAMEPDVLLMDEPFAALDALTRGAMQDELLELWQQSRTTIVFVTHSISEAIRIGTKILLLSAHPGRVIAEFVSDGEDRVDAAGERLSARIHRALGITQPDAEVSHA